MSDNGGLIGKGGAVQERRFLEGILGCSNRHHSFLVHPIPNLHGCLLVWIY